MKLRLQLAGANVMEPGFVPAAEGLPPRYQDEPGTPAWQRALELGAEQRRN